MRKLRKLICLTLTILLALSAMLPVAAEGTSAPNITNIRPTVIPANANSFYFYIEGSNLGTSSSTRIVELIDPAQPGTNLINVTGLSGNENYIRVSCSTQDSTGLAAKTYTLKVTIDGQTVEYTVDAIDTPVIPYIGPSGLPVNASMVKFRLEGSNFDLLTNGKYMIELYVLDESNNETVVAAASSSNMINNGSIVDVVMNFTRSDLITLGRKVYFRIVGPTEVYYGVSLEFTVVDTLIITKYNSVKFNQSVSDSTNPNYVFEFYGYNLNGREISAELRDSGGGLVETLSGTGFVKTDGEEGVAFLLPKSQCTLSGSYTIKVLPNGSRYSISVGSTNPAPVIKELKSQNLPSGYSKFTVRIVGSNLADNASIISFHLYDSANNNILSGRRVNYIYQAGSADKGIEADLYISSSYNNGRGLINGQSYGLVVEINGVDSQPLTVQATDTPMIYKPMAWDITPNATKYYVEFKGYNLQNLDGIVTGANMVDYTSETPKIIAATNNVQLVPDYIDHEHLKFLFENIDLTGMSLNEVAMFEINATSPILYVTGNIGIRISDASYITSYGYDDRATEYYYNAYGFNLTGSYTMTFTYSADPSISYSKPLEMLTEDNVYYKSNVSIPKDSDWPTGDYTVVVKDSSGNALSSRTDHLAFSNGSGAIASIRPAVLPANAKNFYFYINAAPDVDFGTDQNKVEVHIYKTSDVNKTNLVNTNWESLHGDVMQVGFQMIEAGGLTPDEDYTIEIVREGQPTLEYTVQAKSGPQIIYINNRRIPVGATEFQFHIDGNSLQLFKNYISKMELYSIEAGDVRTLVGTATREDMNMYNWNLEVKFTALDSSKLTLDKQLVLVPVIEFPVFYGLNSDEYLQELPMFTISDERYSVSGTISSNVVGATGLASASFTEKGQPLNAAVLPDGTYTVSGLSLGQHYIEGNMPGHLKAAKSVYIEYKDLQDINMYLRAGDVNTDRHIDIDDLVTLSLSYGKTTNIDVRADFDKDGDVDISDLAALGVNYEQNSLDELNISIDSDAIGLDPQLNTGTDTFIVNNAILEGLVRVNDGIVKPGMASSWDVSSDKLTYTFHLRDANWSDGVPVKAQDFVYAIERLLNPSNTQGFANLGYMILKAEAYNRGTIGDFESVGVKALDDKTLEIKLHSESPILLKNLGNMNFMPVRQDIAERYGVNFATSKGAMVYNGPFSIESWRNGDQIVLSRNVNYWDRDSIKLDNVRIYFKPADNIGMYFNNQLDLTDISFNDAVQMRDDGIVDFYNTGAVFSLEFNTVGKTSATGEFLSNADFRKAIGYAIDRQGLIDAVYNGIGEPARRFVMPDVAGIYNSYGEEKPLDFYPIYSNAQAANDALQAALDTLGKTKADIPKFDFMTYNNPSQVARCQALAEMLQNTLGIQVNLIPVNNYFDAKRAGQFDMTLSGWGPDYNDPMTYLATLASNSPNNMTGWHNQTYDALLNQSNIAATPEERYQALFEAEQLMLNESPLVPVYFTQNPYLKKPFIDGLKRGFLFPDIDFIYADVNR